MKPSVNLFFALVFTSVVTPSSSQPITIPRTLSPAAEITQTIGISRVTVKYSRPSVKGRRLWGELVPFGMNTLPIGAQRPSPWRAGANENTTISFSHNARVEGISVPAGVYGLFFVVNDDNTAEVILSKNSTSWGSFYYDSSEDLLRANVHVRDGSFTESLTYDFISLTKNSAELILKWEKKEFPVKVEFDVDDIVIANAKKELRGPIGFNPEGFISAAKYSFESNTDIEQGMQWADQALLLQPTNFDALRIKARILVRMGRAVEADKLIKDALMSASENDITNYGYSLIGLGLYDKAIKVLTTSTERFPKSANAWDSLGEAYAYKGDKPNAVRNFKKALTLNPAPVTKQNSEKYLRSFGEL